MSFSVASESCRYKASNSTVDLTAQAKVEKITSTMNETVIFFVQMGVSICVFINILS